MRPPWPARPPRGLHVLLLIAAVGLGAPAAAGADCPDESAADVLEDRLEEAAAAYADLDVQAFDATMDDAAFAVPCLERVVAPRLAARYHRMQGLRLFVGRDENRAVRAFAAARALEPEADLPPDLVPQGHETRDLYERFDLQSGSFTELPPPAAGWIALDGTRAEQLPADWPSLVQVIDDQGAVQASSYLFPGEALPDYRVDPDWQPPAPQGSGNPLRGVLFGTAGGAAVTAGFTYGLAVASAEAFERDHDWNRSQLDAARDRTNGLVIASAALSAVALGTGVAGLFVSP